MYPRRWFVFAVVVFLYSATSSIAATKAITTFSVASVEPSKTVHPEIRSLSSEDIQRWANKDQILALENVQLTHPLAGGIGYRVSNAFIGTVYKAYSHHYPLELSVEDIWVAIAQGASIHLNENAEKFRHYFVSHDGRKKLILKVDELRLDDNERPSGVNISVPAINWPAAVRSMADLIKADMKAADLVTLISQPFSQTTSVEQAVFDACLMDSVKTYYDYRFALTCGIPHVTLLGSPGDFHSVIDRLNQLKLIFTDLHWWLDPLLSHMQKFKESAEGRPDVDWWQKVCHRAGGGSDISMLIGWLADFVP